MDEEDCPDWRGFKAAVSIGQGEEVLSKVGVDGKEILLSSPRNARN